MARIALLDTRSRSDPGQNGVLVQEDCSPMHAPRGDDIEQALLCRNSFCAAAQPKYIQRFSGYGRCATWDGRKCLRSSSSRSLLFCCFLASAPVSLRARRWCVAAGLLPPRRDDTPELLVPVGHAFGVELVSNFVLVGVFSSCSRCRAKAAEPAHRRFALRLSTAARDSWPPQDARHISDTRWSSFQLNEEACPRLVPKIEPSSRRWTCPALLYHR